MNDNTRTLYTHLLTMRTHDRTYGRMTSGILAGMEEGRITVPEGSFTNGRFFTLAIRGTDAPVTFDAQEGVTMKALVLA